jgi:hypothetical protein
VRAQDTEERQGDGTSETHFDPRRVDLDLDAGIGREVRRAEHVADRLVSADGIQAYIDATGGTELGFVERRGAREGSGICDVVEVPTSGEQSGAVDRESGERETEEHDAHEEHRGLPALTHGKLR